MTNERLLEIMEDLDVILVEMNNLSSNKKDEQSLIDENIYDLENLEKELSGHIFQKKQTRKVLQ